MAVAMEDPEKPKRSSPGKARVRRMQAAAALDPAGWEFIQFVKGPFKCVSGSNVMRGVQIRGKSTDEVLDVGKTVATKYFKVEIPAQKRGRKPKNMRPVPQGRNYIDSALKDQAEEGGGSDPQPPRRFRRSPRFPSPAVIR